MPNFTSEFLNNAQFYAEGAGLDPISVVNQSIKFREAGCNFTDEQLAQYLAGYFYQPYLVYHRNLIRNAFRLVLSFFGFLGYILELMVLFTPEFNLTSMLYYKADCMLEMVVMVYMFQRPILAFPPVSKYYPGSKGLNWFDNIWIYALGEPQSMAADTVTMFVSFERAVALWLPQSFGMINNKKFAWSAISISLFAGAIYWLNFINMSADKNGWPSYISPECSPSEAWRGFFLVRDWIQQIRGWIVCALAVAVAAGYLRLATKPAATNAEEKQREFVKQLAMLSLACSIPVTIQAVFDLIYNNYLSYPSLDVAATTMSFNEAMANVTNVTGANLFAFFVSLSYMISHCTHFYANILLSAKFRKATHKVVIDIYQKLRSKTKADVIPMDVTGTVTGTSGPQVVTL